MAEGLGKFICCMELEIFGKTDDVQSCLPANKKNCNDLHKIFT